MIQLATKPAAPVSRSKAFTLIEIVIVLGILALLAAIGASLGPRIMENGREKRAQADMQVIQQALETYRTRFGDYPKVPDATVLGNLGLANANEFLVNALNGRIGPTWDVINSQPMLNNSLLTFESPGLPLTAIVANRVVDPWGQAFVYEYRPQDVAWTQFGYRLRSVGVDGSDGTADDVVAK